MRKRIKVLINKSQKRFEGTQKFRILIIKKIKVFLHNVVYLVGINLNITCPYALTTKLLTLHPYHTGPLFCHFGGSSETRYQFSCVLNKAISSINLNTTAYKSHSFRIWANTDLTMKSFSPDVIIFQTS